MNTSVVPIVGDHQRVRRNDPGTSAEAAVKAAQFASKHSALILGWLGLNGQGGAEQIGDALGLDAYQVRKRTAELCAANLIEPTGDERKTRSGRHERIWRAKGQASPGSPLPATRMVAGVVGG